MHPQRILCFFVIAFFFVSGPALAQTPHGINSAGTDFFLGLMPTYSHSPGPFSNGEFDYFLIGSFQDNNEVVIHYFDASGNEVVGKSITINKGMCRQVPVDPTSMFPMRPGEVLEWKAAHITSRYPISVQFYSDGVAGSMYQGIPTSALGKKYVIASWFDNPQQSNTNGYPATSSEFMIIAPYDNTTVTFTPNSTTYAGAVGVNTGANSNGSTHPVTIAMHRGQVYWVRSNPTDITNDLSGTTIVSDKPVAVLGGQEAALICDPSSWPGIPVFWDVRDEVAEEMTPVVSWGSEYPSIPTMPAEFLPGALGEITPDGEGDLYRIYTDDHTGLSMNMWQYTSPAQQYGPYGVSLFQAPSQEFGNVTNPVDFMTDSASKDLLGGIKRMYAVQYQYFQMTVDGKNALRAASDMNLIPINHWLLNTIFMVPSVPSGTIGEQDINIITNRDSLEKIFFTVNNQASGTLSSFSATKRYEIPNHPELIGITLKLPPGSYMISGNTPFACYSYGRITAGQDCGLNFGVAGYAAPTGQYYGSQALSNPPKADIIPSCGQWNVRLHEEGGIADVMLLNDPDGYYAKPPCMSYNCRLIGSGSDPSNLLSPPFTVGDTSLGFIVQISDPSKDAYAAVYAVDLSGNDTVIQLHYLAPVITLSTSKVFISDTVVLMERCTHFTFHQTSTGVGAMTTIFDSLDARSSFRISSTPALPAILRAGDSIVFNVCFTPQDTNLHKDSIKLIAGCLDTIFYVQGRGRTPIIVAGDWDFGNVTVGDTVCKNIPVRNIGNYKLILDSNYFLHVNPDYTFEGPIPDTIGPGQQMTLPFCFHPHAQGASESRMDWSTNLTGQYTHHNKDTSALLGYGIAPGLSWDRHQQFFTVECDTTDSVRVWLLNTSVGNEGADLTVTNIQLIGPNASEFTILDYGTGYIPPWQLVKSDSVYVDLRFKAALGNGFAERHAQVIASGADKGGRQYYDTLNCTGIVRHAIVTIDPTTYNFGTFYPNTQVTQKFVITNMGDTAFVFKGLVISDPAFTILSGPAIGSSIWPGMTDTIVIQYNAKSGGGSSGGTLSVIGNFPTCSGANLDLFGISSKVAVSETPANYPITYICQNDTLSISASNNGTKGVILDSIAIVDSSGALPAANQFAFASNGKQLLAPMSGIEGGASVSYPVIYMPSTNSNVAAVAIFYYDDTTNGHERYFSHSKVLTGIGYQARNTLSLQNASTQSDDQYSAVTTNHISVPIRLLHPFDSLARVYGIQLTLRYQRDVFQFDTAISEAGLAFVEVARSSPDPADSTYELLPMRLASLSPIFDSGTIANVNLEYVVAKDSISPLQIKDLMFLDSAGVSNCWVRADTLPAMFYGLNRCGDATLRNYLKSGTQSLSISDVIPNPAIGAASVDYKVAVDGLPVSITLFNLLGEPVETLQKNIPQSKGYYRSTIDVSALPDGLYTILVSSPGFGVSKQFIVTK